MDALKKINWKQPKYMIPLIIYFPLLFVGYFVIDLFHTEKAEIPDGLTTTEYLNPDLPDAKMKGDGIGNKYESMLKSYGKIDDYSAVGNIERNEEDTKEEYDSKYSEEERNQVEAQEAEKLSEMQRQLQESAQKGQEIAKGNNSAENDRLARGKQREQEAMEELNRAIAQARMQAQQVSTPSMQAEVTAKTGDAKEGKVEIPEKKKTNDEPQEVVKKVKVTEDEDTGVKKFSPQTIYVNAPSTKEADRMLRQHMSSSVTEWEIKSIAETKVLGVLGYKQ